MDEMYYMFIPFQEFDGLFIETSAKEGNNISEAVTELSR